MTTQTHFFSTVGSVGVASVLHAVPLSESRSFGRFNVHFQTNSAPQPLVITLTERPGLIQPQGGYPIDATEIALWVLPTDGSSQIVITTKPTRTDPDSLSQDLAQICFKRTQLEFNSEPLMTFCRRRLQELGCAGNLNLGTDVHQFVLLDDNDSDVLSSNWPKRSEEDIPAEVVAIVYRESVTIAKTSKGVGLRIPLELNRRASEIGAHGRGVSILGGHDQTVVNTMMYTASLLLFGLGRLRTTRRDLLSLLESLSSASTPKDIKDAYERATVRSASVRKHGLRLSTEIEAYIDGLSVPEMVVDSFRRSLLSALDLEHYLSVTHRLLDRVASVVESQREDLYLNLRAVETINQSRWSALVSIATALTLPLALLFGYFGISDSSFMRQPLPWILAGLFAAALFLTSWRVKVRNAKQFKRSLKGLR